MENSTSSSEPSSKFVVVEQKLYTRNDDTMIATFKPEVTAWCDENLKKGYRLEEVTTKLPDEAYSFKHEKKPSEDKAGEWITYKSTFVCQIRLVEYGVYFEDEVDMIHFKMRWCG